MLKRRSVPFVEQQEQSECGLCCLAMISRYYGRYLTVLDIQELAQSNRDGLSLHQLLNIAHAIGMDSKVYKGTSEELENYELPAILHWKGHHFVVLEEIKKNSYIITDPINGRMTVSSEEFNQLFSGYIMCIKLGDSFEKKKAKNLWKPYLDILINEKKLLFFLISWSLLLQVLMLMTPIVTNFVIDSIILPKKFELVKTLVIGISIVVLFQIIFTLLRSRLLVVLRNNLDWILMSRFFQHLLHMPYSFFQLRSFGDLMFRANSNMMIRQILSNQALSGFLDISLLIIFTVYLYLQSPSLTLMIFTVGIAYFYTLFIAAKKLQRLSKEELSKRTIVQWHQSEMLYGILGVKMAGMEKKMLNTWEDYYKEQLSATKKKDFYATNLEVLMFSIQIIVPFAVLALGTLQVLSNNISLGGMIAFYTLTITYFTLLSSLATASSEFVKITAYLERMVDILERPREKDGEVKVKELEGNITVKNLNFSYNNNNESSILKNINLNIKQGEKIAIVGKSGSGKSTLANLLIGLYEPTNGEIYFDDLPLTMLDRASLRKKIGIVPQDIHMFNRSIFDNITIYYPDANLETVVQAAKLAKIHQDIISLPLGYNTIISEFGTNFSGGQKQRIALARALINQPSILLLDEATSSLDAIVEKEIDQILSELRCTRIVITHRLNTVKNADKIIVLDRGEIVEIGTHSELLSKKGHYYQLDFSSQDKNYVS